MTVLYKKSINDELYEWSIGSTALLSDYEVNNQPLTICIKCSFGTDPSRQYYALFDTGARWTVVPASIAKDHDMFFFSLESEKQISTRFGLCKGILHSCDIQILADEGEDIPFETTVLVIPDEIWPYPIVLGFNSCLNKIRWACDPNINNQGRLYFGLNDEQI